MPESPVLIPDACALLDVLRGALGVRPQATSVIPFMRLTAASSDGELQFVLPELSMSGYNRNLNRVTAEIARHGNHILAGMSLLISGHAALPDSESLVLSGPTPSEVPNDWATKLAAAWARAIRLEIAGWVREDRSDADTTFARDRMAAGLAPCRPGGEGFEDAEILSCALRTAAGNHGHTVFVSSNTKDFCNSGKSEVHSELEDCFAANGLTLATTWGAALGMI